MALTPSPISLDFGTQTSPTSLPVLLTPADDDRPALNELNAPTYDGVYDAMKGTANNSGVYFVPDSSTADSYVVYIKHKLSQSGGFTNSIVFWDNASNNWWGLLWDGIANRFYLYSEVANVQDVFVNSAVSYTVTNTIYHKIEMVSGAVTLYSGSSFASLIKDTAIDNITLNSASYTDVQQIRVRTDLNGLVYSCNIYTPTESAENKLFELDWDATNLYWINIAKAAPILSTTLNSITYPTDYSGDITPPQVITAATTLNITYDATVTSSGDVTVNYTESGGSPTDLDIPVEGVLGITATITPTPTTLNYMNVIKDDTRTLYLLLTTSNVSVTVNATFTLTGDYEIYNTATETWVQSYAVTIEEDCCFEYMVRFSPDTVGRDDQTISLAGNFVDSPLSIPVYGNCIDADTFAIVKNTDIASTVEGRILANYKRITT